MNSLEGLSNTPWLLTATSRSISNLHLTNLKGIVIKFLKEQSLSYEEIQSSKFIWNIRFNNLNDAERTIGVLMLNHDFLDERQNASSEVFLRPDSKDPNMKNMAIKIGARPPTPDDLKTAEEVYFIQYLPDHTLPATRWAHIIPTMLTGAAVAYNTYKGNWSWALGSLAGGTALIYECGFHSHLFIERNIPSATKYFVQSAYSELRMTVNTVTNFWTGAMDRDLAKAGITKKVD